MRSRSFAIFTLLFIVLFSLSYSQTTSVTQINFQSLFCPITSQTTSFSSCFNSSIGIALIAVLISFMLVGLLYMIGSIFKTRGFENWYKRELWESIKSLMIVVIIFAVLVILSVIAISLTGQSTSSPAFILSSGNTQTTFESSITGFYTSVYNNYITPQYGYIQDDFAYMYGLSLGTALLKSLTISIYTPIPIPVPFTPIIVLIGSGSTFQPYTSGLISTNSGSGTFLSDSADFVILIYSIFAFMETYFYPLMIFALSALLPLGIILRAIPFLREIGGGLIAISITVAFVFPMLLLVFNLPVTNLIFNTFNTNPGCNFGTGFLGESLNYYVCNYVFSSTLASQSTSPIGTLFLNNIQTYYGVLEGFLGAFSIYPSVNLITYSLIDALISFIVFALDVLICIIIADNLAGILGGKIWTGFGRFRLA